MTTFWQFLPFLIKLVMALVGTGWFAGNVALSQVGSGVDLSSDWWKLLLPLLIGGTGAVTTVTHHYNSNKTALNAAPPAGSSKEYLSRVAAEQVMNGNTDCLAAIGELTKRLK